MKMFTIAALIFFAVLSASAQVKSVYTSLAPKACKDLKENSEEGLSYEGACPGVGRYKIRLLEGDMRQTLDLITPKGKRIELAFGQISAAFTYFGDKIEWRMKGAKLLSFIVRFNVNEDPESTMKVRSKLVVVRVSGNDACITDVVEPSKNQNAEARSLADKVGSKPCKFHDPE